MIRKAKPKDKHDVARLCYIIWDQLDLELVENTEKERLLKIMEQSVVDVNYRGHYSNTWVYEIDGNIAGCLIVYPGSKEIELVKAWIDKDLEADISVYITHMHENKV